MPGKRTERNKSRRKTPWEGNSMLTPTQKFISRQYEEHYMQRHPRLDETGEVELINSFHPSKCVFVNKKVVQKGSKKLSTLSTK